MPTMAVLNSERPILPPAKKLPTPLLDNQLEEDSGDFKTLRGYFEKNSVAAVNEKGFLQQLVLNKSTLSTGN